MPHMGRGHLPGAVIITCGCIGHVYTVFSVSCGAACVESCIMACACVESPIAFILVSGCMGHE